MDEWMDGLMTWLIVNDWSRWFYTAPNTWVALTKSTKRKIQLHSALSFQKQVKVGNNNKNKEQKTWNSLILFFHIGQKDEERQTDGVWPFHRKGWMDSQGFTRIHQQIMNPPVYWLHDKARPFDFSSTDFIHSTTFQIQFFLKNI